LFDLAKPVIARQLPLTGVIGGAAYTDSAILVGPGTRCCLGDVESPRAMRPALVVNTAVAVLRSR
jgi:hypothetical protein